MASKTYDVIRYNDTEYDLNDKGDVIELFNDLISTINYLRCAVRDLQRDTDYISRRTICGYNSEEE